MSATFSKPVRVAIVDDQQLFLDGISSLLSACPELEVVGTAMSGVHALSLFEQRCPEIVLLDLSMPERDGMEVLNDLKAHFTQIKVIMLTVHDDLPSIQECLRRGAMGYVLKINGKDELLHAILEVAGGRKYLDPKVLDTLIGSEKSRSVSGQKSFSGSDSGLLSVREREVLLLISEGKTSEHIARQLFLSVNTIDTHRKNIISKLNARNITDAVRMALQKGMI
jgi:DNA-binding NarL/FixJ family response regulator